MAYLSIISISQCDKLSFIKSFSEFLTSRNAPIYPKSILFLQQVPFYEAQELSIEMINSNNGVLPINRPVIFAFQ